MGKRLLERELRKVRRFAFRGHSSAYRYIREHFEQITAAGFGSDDGPPWQKLVELLTRAGQLNAKRQPLKAPAVAAVFKRVRRDVAKERSYQLTGVKPARHQPSRALATWQPPVARSPPAAHSGSPGQAVASPPARASPNPPVSGAVPGEDSFDRAFRRLAERSGR